MSDGTRTSSTWRRFPVRTLAILAICIALAATACCAIRFAFADDDPEVVASWDISKTEGTDSVTATLYDDGTFAISGSGNIVSYSGRASTPWYQDGYADQIKKITIEDTVTPTSFAYYFYKCTNLTEVFVLPDTVTNTQYMFDYCSSLTELPEGFTLSSKVTTCNFMFYSCTSLASLPDGFQIANSKASCRSMFSNCSSLTVLPEGFMIPSSGTTASMFGLSTSTTGYSADNLLVTYCSGDDYEALAEAYDWEGSYRSLVPIYTLATWDISAEGDGSVTATLYDNGVLEIEGEGDTADYSSASEVPWYAEYASTVVTVTIEDTVTPDDLSYYFYGCTNLTAAFVLPDSVTAAKSMFQGCTSLASLPDGFTIGDNVTTCQQMFYGCTSLKTLPSGFTIGDSVTTCQQMFDGCTALKSLPSGFQLGSSVTSCLRMFASCSKLSSLPDGFTIPDNATTLTMMFYGCDLVTTLPDGFSIPSDANTMSMFATTSSYSSSNLLATYCSYADYEALAAAYDWESSNRELVAVYPDSQSSSSTYAYRESDYGEAPNGTGVDSDDASPAGMHITTSIVYSATVKVSDSDALAASIAVYLNGTELEQDDYTLSVSGKTITIDIPLEDSAYAGLVCIEPVDDSFGILDGITVGGDEVALDTIVTLADTGLSFEAVEVVAGDSASATVASTTFIVTGTASVRSMNHVVWLTSAGTEDGTGISILANDGDYSQSTAAEHDEFWSFTCADAAAAIAEGAAETLADAGYTVTDNGDGTFTIAATEVVDGEILWAAVYTDSFFSETDIEYGETVEGIEMPEATDGTAAAVTTALESELARADGLSEDDYGVHSWAAYAAAVEAAQSVLDDSSATQDDVNSATALLRSAYAALLPADDETDATAHVWGDPEWSWSEDCSSATVTLVCTICDETSVTEAKVTQEKTVGGYNCTATVTVDGTEYTTSTFYEVTTYTLSRIGGTNRYATAALEALEAYGDSGCTTVIIATGENFPDSLSATSLAGALDAPILLTKTAELSSYAADAIDALGATEAIVVGGTGAVSESVVSALEADGITVTRLAGANRYETAEQIYVYGLTAGDDGGNVWGDTLILASGAEFADALSISSLAYAQAYPILLADSDGDMRESTVSIVSISSFDSAIVTGGLTAVSADAASELESIFGEGSVERLAGANRYETSVQIAEYATENGYLGWDEVALASGETFPDALAGSALQGSDGAVLLLVSDKRVDTITNCLSSVADQILTVRLFGGTGAVSESVQDAVVEALGWDEYESVLVNGE